MHGVKRYELHRLPKVGAKKWANCVPGIHLAGFGRDLVCVYKGLQGCFSTITALLFFGFWSHLCHAAYVRTRSELHTRPKVCPKKWANCVTFGANLVQKAAARTKSVCI